MKRLTLPLLLAAGLAACGEEPTRAPEREPTPVARVNTAGIDRCPAPGDVLLSVIDGLPEQTFPSAINERGQVVIEYSVWTALNGARYFATLPGHQHAFARDINEQGHATGFSATEFFFRTEDTRPVLWTTPSEVRNLGTLVSGGGAQGTALNDRDQVVGWGQVDGGASHAFLWTAATGMRDLGTLPGDVYSEATGINNRGEVVGTSIAAGFEARRAFLWTASAGMREIRPPAGFTSFRANDINDQRQVVGGAETANGVDRAFLKNLAGGFRNLGTLGGNRSSATAINELGQVVGFSAVATGGLHAFVWSAERGMRDLGLPPGTSDSFARDINNRGQIVGDAALVDGGGTGVAVLWTLIDRRPNYQTILAIGPEVQSRVRTGELSPSQARALVRRLEAALRELDLHHPRAAVTRLREFVSAVETLIRDGTLSRASGQPLIDLANCAIAGLS